MDGLLLVRLTFSPTDLICPALLALLTTVAAVWAFQRPSKR